MTTLKKLKRTATRIVQTSVGIMKLLETEDQASDLLDDFLSENFPNGNGPAKNDLLETMQTMTLPWTVDAEVVLREVDSFIKSSGDRGETWSVDLSKNSFLAEVWSGDAYDAQGVEGLKALHAELERHLAEISWEKLCASVLVRLSPPVAGAGGGGGS